MAPGGLCLGGASAGGNLAVGAAMYLKDTGLALPAKLLLAYPFLHAGLPPLEPAAVPDGSVLSALPRILRFTEDDCRGMVENYIGGPAGMASSYALPGMPTLAAARRGGDACEDDTCAPRLSSSSSLDAADVPVAFRLEAGATHGYLTRSAALGSCSRSWHYLLLNWTRRSPFND